MTDVLDLEGVAAHLQVNFWRARRWRRNAINSTGERRLVAPDVLSKPPRWSAGAVESWARGEGLWPPGADQYVCSHCHRTGSVYTGEEMIMRDHGWQEGPDGRTLIACAGSGMRAQGKASLATA